MDEDTEMTDMIITEQIQIETEKILTIVNQQESDGGTKQRQLLAALLQQLKEEQQKTWFQNELIHWTTNNQNALNDVKNQITMQLMDTKGKDKVFDAMKQLYETSNHNHKQIIQALKDHLGETPQGNLKVINGINKAQQMILENHLELENNMSMIDEIKTQTKDMKQTINKGNKSTSKSTTMIITQLEELGVRQEKMEDDVTNLKELGKKMEGDVTSLKEQLSSVSKEIHENLKTMNQNFEKFSESMATKFESILQGFQTSPRTQIKSEINKSPKTHIKLDTSNDNEPNWEQIRANVREKAKLRQQKEEKLNVSSIPDVYVDSKTNENGILQENHMLNTDPFKMKTVANINQSTNSSQWRLQMMPGNFRKIKDQVGLTKKINRLRKEAESYLTLYDPVSIWVKLRAALPHEVTDTIEAQMEGKEYNFKVFLEQMTLRYNNPHDLQTEANKLLDFRLDVRKSIAEGCAQYIDQVVGFNSLCKTANRPGSTWTAQRLMENIVRMLTSYNVDFAAKVQDIWNQEVKNDPAMENSINGALIKEIVSRVETGDRLRKRGKQKPSLLATLVNFYAWSCWRCDAKHRTKRGQKGTCNCGKVAICNTCGGNHLTKYHAVVERVRARMNSDVPSFNRPNEQGGKLLLAQQEDYFREEVLQTSNWDEVIQKQEDDMKQEDIDPQRSVLCLMQSQRGKLKDSTGVDSLIGVYGIIANSQIAMVVDSGGQFNALSVSTFKKLRLEQKGFQWEPTEDGEGASGQRIQCICKVTVPVEIGNDCFLVEFRVVNDLPVSCLLGVPTLKHSKLDLKEMVLELPSSKVKMWKFSDMTTKITHTKDNHLLLAGNWEKGDYCKIHHELNPNLPKEKLAFKLADSTDAKAHILKELAILRENELKNAPSKEAKDDVDDTYKLLKEIIGKYVQLFDTKFTGGKLKITPIKFQFSKDMSTIDPICKKMKSMSKKEMEIVRKWCEKALEQGIIERSRSQWRSAIFPVRKPDGLNGDGEREERWRIVTPYFGLNALLKQNGVLLPRIDDVMIELANQDWYSLLDLTQSFFQLMLDEQSRPYTAFSAPGLDLFQYKTLPMGLTISPSILQLAMVQLLKDVYFRGAIVYMDDIIIYSRGTKQQHIALVERVLHTLQEANANLKLSKVKIAVKEVTFLGQTVTNMGWKISAKYLTSLKKLSMPSSFKELRSILGVFNWQRRFLCKYTECVKPLQDLLKLARHRKSFRENWSQEHAECFSLMRTKLSQQVLLRHPDFTKPFILYSDASKVGLGGILVQQLDNVEASLGFFSRKLDESEQNRSIPERELMALVESLEFFRAFIHGIPTSCRVDQRSIKWLVNSCHPSKFTKYRIRLERFVYTIDVIAGSANKADVFSRYGYEMENQAEDKNCVEINKEGPLRQGKTIRLLISLEASNVSSFVGEGLQESLEREMWFLSFRRAIAKNQPSFKVGRFKLRIKDFSLEKGNMHYENRLFVAKAYKLSLIHKIHCINQVTAHAGMSTTIGFVRKRYFWIGFQADIRNFIASCVMCHKAKTFRNFKHWGQRIMMGMKKTQGISVDHYGILALPISKGYQGILTIQDVNTGFIQVIPVKTKSSEETAKILLNKWINIFGLPTNFHSDNAREFIAGVVREVCLHYGINATSCGIYGHHQNGKVERVHKTLTEQIKLLKLSDGNLHRWPEFCSMFALKFNACLHREDGDTPFYNMFGIDVRIPDMQNMSAKFEENLLKETKQKKLEMIKRVCQKKQTTNVVLIGDIVFTSFSTKATKFEVNGGPFRVMEKKGSNLYIVQDIDSGERKQVALSNLRLGVSPDGSV